MRYRDSQGSSSRGNYRGQRANKALDNAWRTVNPAPVIMLHGSEEYFASRARERLRTAFYSTYPNADLVTINASTYTAGNSLSSRARRSSGLPK